MEVRKRFVAKAMKTWITLNDSLAKMTAEEVVYALELENEQPTPRKTFLKRLAQRYNGIRGEEIRRELE
jgi:hypothetical protein